MSKDKGLIPGSVTSLDNNPPDRLPMKGPFDVHRVQSTLVDPEPTPKDGTGPAIWDLVISDLSRRWQRSQSPLRMSIWQRMILDSQARDEFGRQKYKKRLRCGDGRDSLVDGYQEILDLAVYLRKEIENRLERGSGDTKELRLVYDEVLNLWFKLRHILYRRDGN